jgi:DNA-binding NarL/FixJ family response regulator
VVVDSDPAFLEDVCGTLESRCPEAKVFSASNGVKGLRLALETNAQVVVCEQEARGKNALEICSTLVAQSGEEARKIIVVGKRVDRLQRRLFKDLGAVELVAKGDEPRALAELVLELVRVPHEDSGNSGYLPSV